MMTTTRTSFMVRVIAAVTLALVAGCGNGNKNNGTPDLATQGGGNDMAQPPCVMNPTTSVELLNACTTAQSGDPAKDAPYFPSLAPNGNLPPLP